MPEKATMLTATQQSKFRRRLEAQRDRLQASIGMLDAEVEELANYEDGEQATLGNHPADGGTELYEQEQTLTLEQNERDILDRVEHALARLAEGTYGRCENCGQAIGRERLEALPHATLCITCQSALEHGA